MSYHKNSLSIKILTTQSTDNRLIGMHGVYWLQVCNHANYKNWHCQTAKNILQNTEKKFKDKKQQRQRIKLNRG